MSRWSTHASDAFGVCTTAPERALVERAQHVLTHKAREVRIWAALVRQSGARRAPQRGEQAHKGDRLHIVLGASLRRVTGSGFEIQILGFSGGRERVRSEGGETRGPKWPLRQTHISGNMSHVAAKLSANLAIDISKIFKIFIILFSPLQQLRNNAL